ncbi:MAG: hypothetical protein JRF40_07590 [Deltaproteobacteria bacterium]|nr:hypothetical protein [Deltaproteobacteria bacterium]MBW2219337.1 hypothetical protein [Deltaproteobacteria bacterium]
MQRKTSFNQSEIEAFKPAEKIGVVALKNPQGLPHITLITSIQASGPSQMTLGEFCKGKSKEYIQKSPDIAFIIMTMDKKMWRGRAKWTHLKNDGPEYEEYNNTPMFRYNAYFGINTVHYLDLIETGGKESLPLGKIVLAALLTKLAKGSLKHNTENRILKSFAENIFNDLSALKFISYIGEDGWPVLFPVLQCQASDSKRLTFSSLAFGEELSKIKNNTTVAVFGITMGMEDVLVRGTFNGFKRSRGIKTGMVDIDWVYNSMPPCHGQIYPKLELNPVVNF